MDKLLFIDIETHRVLEFNQLSDQLINSFNNHYLDGVVNIEGQFNAKAGLLPEFSRVICVSVGYEDADETFKKLSIYGTDEKELLLKLKEVLEGFSKAGYKLAGHNIKKFDIPYLAKRYIINRIPIPKLLNVLGLKPWEVDSVDTIEIWKFGSYAFTSLEVMCASLGIQCKSTEISGNNLYAKSIGEIDFKELVIYCEEDIESCYKCYKIIKEYI